MAKMVRVQGKAGISMIVNAENHYESICIKICDYLLSKSNIIHTI